MSRLFIVLLLTLSYNWSLTQDQEIHFNQLTTSDGLSQNTVDHILQDKFGQMWFCTLVGVDKYDGQAFTTRVFKKALSEEITTLFQWCKEEKIILGTSEGLYTIDIITNELDTLGLKHKNVLKVFYNQDSSALYLFTRNQIIQTDFSGTIETVYPIDYEITDVVTATANTFVAASGKDLLYIQPEKEDHSKKLESVAKEITALCIDNNKKLIYIGTKSLGLYSYRFSDNAGIEPYLMPRVEKNWRNAAVSTLMMDRNTLWVGTDNLGLYVFKEEKKNRPIVCLAEGNYRPKIDISKNKIRSLYASKDGVIWVGTDAGGINTWQDKKQLFRYFFRGEYSSSASSDEGIRIDSLSTYDNETWGIFLFDERTVWLGTDQNGIAVVDLVNNSVVAQKVLPMGAKIELPPDLLTKAKTVFCFKRLGDRIYLGTDAGIFQTKSYWRYYHPTRFLGKGVSLLEFDSMENQWWAGKRSDNKIYRLDRKFNLVDSLVLAEDERLSFIQKRRDTTIWVGTTNGVCRYRYSYNGWYSEEKDRLLPGIHVSCMSQSKLPANTWLGTDGQGIHRYNNKTQNIDLAFGETNEEFPVDETIYALVQDSFGNVWFSMNHGIGRLNPVECTFNFYTVEDGLQSDEFNAGAVYTNEQKQVFYFAGVDGLNSFHVNQSEITEPLPKLSLLKYAYPSNQDKEGLGKIEKTLKVPIRSIRLPNQFKYVEFIPTLFDYQDPSNNQFRCKLNDGPYVYPTNGKFIFPENNFKNPFFRKHYLHFEYRTGRSAWQIHPPIQVIRGWFSWLYLFFVVTAIGLGLLLWTLWINSRGNKRLNRIQEKINDISRLDKTSDLSRLALKHFIDPKVFGFHYVIISFVDFYKKEIGIRYYHAGKDVDVGFSEKWQELSTYDLDIDKDILVQVANSKRPVKVVGKKVHDPLGEITSQALNEEIFDGFKHQRLARLFVPITHRIFRDLPPEAADIKLDDEDYPTSRGERGDIVMGVVEAGYKLNFLERIFIRFNNFFKLEFRLRKELKLDKNEVRLKLYTDNFAQPYYRALLKEQRKKLYEQVVEQSEQNSQTHHEFLKNVLHKFGRLFNANYGNIAFRTFNSRQIDILDRGLYYNFKAEKVEIGRKKFKGFNQDQKGIISHVVNLKEPYFSGNVLEDDYYERFFEEVNSEIGIPMINEYQEVIGVLILSSKRKDFFNDLHAKILKKVMDKATEYYTRIKRYNSLQKITSHFDIFSQNRLTIYEAAAASLNQYFDSDNISIWERDANSNHGLTYKLIYTSNKNIHDCYQTLGLLQARIKKQAAESTPNGIIKIQQMKDYSKKESRIYQLCQKEKFASFVALGVVAEGKYEAFINIFSRRKLPNQFNRYSRRFLEQITKNTGLAIQGFNLIRAVESISKSLSKGETPNTLQVLVDNAREFLTADLVALFPYRDRTREILLKEGYFAGNFPEQHQSRKNRRANIANYIIKKGTHWVENEKQYEEIFWKSITSERGKKTFDDSFWRINNIQSVAAIRLEHDGQPMGVLFVNYLTPKDFSEEENIRFINAFTNLSATALINEGYISRIREETIKLGIEKLALEKQKAEIQFEFDKVYEKIEEMLPRATRASYYLILQGINHDVRTFLLILQGRLIKLKGSNVWKKFNRTEHDFLINTMNSLDQHVRSITNLLDLFAYQEYSKKEVIDVNEDINSVILFFENKDKLISFDKKFKSNLNDLFCYKTEFSMIMYNLVNNAVQAIQERGENYQGLIRIKSDFKDKRYYIYVEDNGIGIDNALQEKVFSFGFTTKDAGIGIGLYFVKETIEKSFSGEITVRSEKGKGTKFSIMIPEHINYLKS